MTSAEITQSIANWENDRQNTAKLLGYFHQGNAFAFTIPAYAAASPKIHAYPGIYNNAFYFFMVPSNYDKDQYVNTINQYTTVCKVQTIVGGGNIDSKEALLRIANWNNNYNTWVPQQVNSSIGIYEAFAIDIADFEVQSTKVSFALKSTPQATVSYAADLIVTNNIGNVLAFDDFVQSVPPFGAAAIAQANFALLP